MSGREFVAEVLGYPIVASPATLAGESAVWAFLKRHRLGHLYLVPATPGAPGKWWRLHDMATSATPDPTAVWAVAEDRYDALVVLASQRLDGDDERLAAAASSLLLAGRVVLYPPPRTRVRSW